MPGARKETADVAIDIPPYIGRAASLGDYTVTFDTFREAVDPGPLFSGLPDDRCQCPHWGVVLSGRLTFRYRDHEEVFEAGDAYYASPGHLPLPVAGTECVEFSPTVELNRTNAVIEKNMNLAGVAQS